MSETRMEYHWGRLMRCYVDRPPTVDAMFRQAVARATHAEAVVDGGIRIDYGELDARVDRVAARLRKPEIAYIFGDAEPVAVIHEASLVAELPEHGPKTDMRFCVGSGDH